MKNLKKFEKIISIVIIALMFACFCTNVFAALDIDSMNANEPLGDADDSMTKIGSTILTFITNVAMILAVVVLAVLGVKYMMGSTEEKAEYKKSLIPYVVGAFLVFSAGAIGKMIISFGQSLNN